MNFYDEAIEAKHSYLNQLVRQQQSIRKMIKESKVQAVESHIDLEHLLEPNINALRQSEPYFWDSRIIELVIASGEQLPETITFDDSWLLGRAGYWWLGRASPLVGVTEGENKWHVYSLLWWVEADHLHVTTLDIFEREHNQLGAFTWRRGETLADAVARLRSQQSVSRASCRIDLLLDKIITDKQQELVKVLDDVVQVAQKASEVDSEIQRRGGDSTSKIDLQDEKERRDLAVTVAELYSKGHEGRVRMWKEASANALRAFACGSLWLQQKIVVTEYGKLDRHAERRLARANISTNVRVVHLRSKSYVQATPDEEKKQVDWAWQWAVCGHWRNQPTNDGIKLIWIHPFIKGPEDKPLKPGVARVFAVTR